MAGSTRTAILGVLTALATGPVLAGPADTMVLLQDSAAAHWAAAPASLPKGIQISLLMGDPSKPGPFVLRLKIPANTVIAPHTHATPETVTVLTGGLDHDMGETLDKRRGQHLETGGFVYLPADMPHSLWTAAQAAEIEVSGTGPFGLHYVNPADDPSKKS